MLASRVKGERLPWNMAGARPEKGTALAAGK